MNAEQWALEIREKIRTKLRGTASRTEISFPYTLDGAGRFKNAKSSHWWTNGFWAGTLWLLYLDTGEDLFRTRAEAVETELDKVILNYDGLHHDVGFMWLLTAVKDFEITGNEQSRKRGMLAASLLAARYNIKGHFLRAWNTQNAGGWVIIDSMMNIPLLHWATKMSGDERFSYIALEHADKVMNHFIRPDGSVMHIVNFDTHTGDFIENFAGQGFDVGSSWTRGQSWAIYGFALSYLATQKEEYLQTAKKVADYFLSCLNEAGDYVPPCDFRSPKEPVYKDTTAGCIAACGLLEIAKLAAGQERARYLDGAIAILTAIENECCEWTTEEDAVVMMGTESYAAGHNMPIIYGDYYFIEAVYKLLEFKE